MPNINDMLLKLEGFQYATSLDLNMRYYHIQLSENVSNFCTSTLPLEKYCYKHLLLGFENSQNIFQQKVNDLFQGFEFNCAYIYEILMLIKIDWIYREQNSELYIVEN